MTVVADTDGLPSQLRQQLCMGKDALSINDLGGEKSCCDVPDPFKRRGWKRQEKRKSSWQWEQSCLCKGKERRVGEGVAGCCHAEDGDATVMKTSASMCQNPVKLKWIKWQSQRATTRVLLVTNNIHHYNAGFSQSWDKACSRGAPWRAGTATRDSRDSRGHSLAVAGWSTNAVATSTPAWLHRDRHCMAEHPTWKYWRPSETPSCNCRFAVLVVIKQENNITVQT